MLKKITGLLSIVLCLTLFLPVSALALQATAAGTDYATVYVRGSTDIYKYNEDGSKYALYDDGEYLESILKDAAPKLLAGNYDAYAKQVLDILRPAYAPFRPSLKDGSVAADTHIDWQWNETTIRYFANRNTYFEYYMDERLSPFVVAEDLHNFIETVKRVTGKNKVLLYARCLGPVAAMTYLYTYEKPTNYSGIYGVILSFSTHEGMALTDALYTGTLKIPSDAAAKWLTNADMSEAAFSAEEEKIVSVLLKGIANSLSMKLTANTLNNLYSKLKNNLFKPLLKEYYVLRLMDTACVNTRFNDMMNYLFSGKDDAKTYAYAIGELTKYHTTVYPAINGMLKDLLKRGKNVVVVADYGGQQYPVSEESEYLGDFRVGTKAQSLGATTAKLDATLSDSYLSKRTAAGYGKYISPDKKVDASTCALRDHTYFVSNLNHTWPAAYIGQELALIDAADVNADPNRPQFLFWDEKAGKLVPLANTISADGGDSAQQSGILGFFRRIADFFRNIIEKIRAIFSR